MSNYIELVRSFYEQDDNLFNSLHPDIVWHETEGFPYGGVYRGVREILDNVFAHIGEDWRDFRAHAETVLPVGQNQVLTTGRYSGISVATGKEMSASFAHLYTFRDDKVVEFRQFGDSLMFVKPMLADAA